MGGLSVVTGADGAVVDAVAAGADSGTGFSGKAWISAVSNSAVTTKWHRPPTV
jgi:hypothetical protein